eukprot:355489-Chlamydomonas_euryale.AAC.13
MPPCQSGSARPHLACYQLLASCVMQFVARQYNAGCTRLYLPALRPRSLHHARTCEATPWMHALFYARRHRSMWLHGVA